MTAGPATSLKVGLLGYGAIGQPVARALRQGRAGQAELVAVSTSSRPPCPEATDVDNLIARSDLVVEAAGHEAVRRFGTRVREAGTDLMIVSVGAMADRDVYDRLWCSGPGRLLISSGAIGGLDLLRSACLAGPVTVGLTSTKRPSSLIQPWMSEGLAATLRALQTGDEAVVVFDGPARQAALQFPANANVAATLALAIDDWDAVTVRIVADPGVLATTHEVAIAAETGCYHLSFRNVPSPQNPASSRLVADAVIRAVADRAAERGTQFL